MRIGIIGAGMIGSTEASRHPVIVGALARAREFEPETRTYNTGMSGRELREAFGVA